MVMNRGLGAVTARAGGWLQATQRRRTFESPQAVAPSTWPEGLFPESFE